MPSLATSVQLYLEALIRKYNSGERDQRFADWAAITAIFLLEFHDLLD